MKLLAIGTVMATSFALGFAYYNFAGNKTNLTDICPAGTGNYMLPRTYPGKSLLVGYTDDPAYITFINEVIESVVEQNLSMDVNILIPKDEVNEAYNNLAKFRTKAYKQFVHKVTTSSTEAMWVQDYVEHAVHLETMEDILIELPYWERDGAIMPKIVSLFKRWDLIEAPKFYPEGELHTHADYGGDIEALPYNFILVGQSMANTLKTHLRKILPHQKLIEVPTLWVENNHVDEIFTLLPTPVSSCGFVIGYASPQRAMELLPLGEDQPLFDLSQYETDQDKYNFSECNSSKNFLNCTELVKANISYQKEIDTALTILKAHLQPQCADLEFVPMPQLFVPIKVFSEYGTFKDNARAFNPSVVNSLIVGRHVFYSHQLFTPFAEDVKKVLTSYELVAKPLESSALQSSGGGFHCASLMINSCVK